MTQETLGYIELEWTCKRCGTKNPGSQKTCHSCGAAMDAQDQFELPAQQVLLTEPEKVEATQAGPDVHCPYCGTRNPVAAKTCVQCGAELGEATAREAGHVLGAFQTGPVVGPPCPYCGEPNLPNAPRCSKCGGDLIKRPSPPPPPGRARPNKTGLSIAIGVGVLILVCICAIAFSVLSMRTSDASGMVQSLAWERTIQILEQRPVTRDAWQDQLPSGAEKGSCTRKIRSTQSQPAPGAEKVCSTPYVIDQGSGKGKVVQDCSYNVYDDWCRYTIKEWQVVNQLVARGGDVNPHWPESSLRSDQREGERDEKYLVTLLDNDKQYTYAAANAAEFARFTPGSRWTFKVNALGGVSGLQPVK
jgi:ribosomal protein L40E